MPLRRFFVPPGAIAGGSAVLPPDQAHHLIHVLRLKSGQEVEIFDGEGRAHIGKVELGESGVRIVGLRLSAEAEAADAVSIVLAAALIKPDRFEWVIQKATELGVADIVPVETRFCSARVPEAKRADRLLRWRRIAEEASRQSCRNRVPRVHEIRTFRHFLSIDQFPAHAKYICYEKSTSPWKQDCLVPAALLCVGPEGGWDTAEIEAAQETGYRIFGLGQRILRAETAALAALTLFQLRLTGSGVHI